jgi:hypothetical protein
MSVRSMFQVPCSKFVFAVQGSGFANRNLERNLELGTWNLEPS